MANYFDKEKRCQEAFEKASSELGGFWHVCTPGDLIYSFNSEPEDFKFSVSNLAISAAEVGVVVITDQVMSNHIHSIVACTKEKCQLLVDAFRYRERKHLRSKGLYYELDGLSCEEPIAIESLQALRKEIVYCNRNGYLVDPGETPFSYQWGGGSLYFNPYAQMQSGIPANKISYKDKRRLSCRSACQLPPGYMLRDGMILPNSYVDYRLGQAMFRDAHHYFSMISKDYETFSELAIRFGDKVVVTDEEMFSIVMLLSKRDYDGAHPTLLSPSAKIEIARKLHKDYNATPTQLKRILKMDMADVNAVLGL